MLLKIIELSKCICGEDPIFQKRTRGRMLFVRCPACGSYGDDALTPKGCASKWNKKIFKQLNAINCLNILGEHMKKKVLT